MASVLIHAADESVTLTARAVQGLLERGDGDAALLYLALLRRHGTVAPRALAGELRWDRGRIEAAERTLRELGLVAPAAESVPEPADERPEYPREDIARHLDGDGEFRGLVAEVERKLGKKLTTPDVGVLLGLSDYLGLPADVIYLLVCHCAERVARRYGEGRQAHAAADRKGRLCLGPPGNRHPGGGGGVSAPLRAAAGGSAGLHAGAAAGRRAPSASEEKYLSAWQEMGFEPEAVAIAYDKTVLRCHEFKWPYCNGILKKWHEAGLHTAQEIREKDHPPRVREEAPASGGDEVWKYVQQLHRDRG